MSKGKGIVRSTPTASGGHKATIIVSEHLEPPSEWTTPVGGQCEIVNSSALPMLQIGDIVECYLNPENSCEFIQFLEKSVLARGRVTQRPEERSEGNLDGKLMIIQEPNPNLSNVRANIDELSFPFSFDYSPHTLWPGDIVDCLPTGQMQCVIAQVVQHVEQGG
jgi:uncharacterized Zn-binding protein involved in type VI secretion